MKKITIVFLISIFGQCAFAQSKADEKELNIIKRYFLQLKSAGMDTKQVLLWEYTYSDSLKTTLEQLSKAFENEELKTKEVSLSTIAAPHTYNLIVTEEKKYKTPELLNERLKQLNAIAKTFKIVEPTARIATTNVPKETDVDGYKKVGKKIKE